MRTSSLVPSLVALLAAAPSAFAQLARMRGTIPGSLHQCEATNVFFFDTGNARPVTLVLLPAAVAPAAATVTLDQVLALGPLQVVANIATPDAQQTNFVLAIAEGESFVSYGFLPDGTGKNLNLARTVQASLPGAVACNPATAARAAAAVAPAPVAATTTTPRVVRVTTTPAAAATTPAIAAVATTTTLPTLALPVSSSSSSSSSSASADASAAAANANATSGASGKVAGASVVAGAVVAAAVAAMAL
ncbi:hypothetical protein Rhopal_007335-T1 [Rhodotorula paludigena]|uniref:Uncharacterized protein n=1 Tax=Rhodotorula paludigena TaxID=86838 RepID=A0AAV5GNU9_9BASI|nr:hypothetical protein Rhopal_007335-T1 [Rhodotorula paludigena]